ncbi:hypothetical protein FHETE_3136 [Fusarium heterosporum]|uniref:Uncharacterized protein n=1 Tax=Fusarium heterosporum TaxID=42747 RepID=A0A8H5TQ92_FUSHE|nr:hypothetical protein FHETE_3136 [Fusarium heterosporum]
MANTSSTTPSPKSEVQNKTRLTTGEKGKMCTEDHGNDKGINPRQRDRYTRPPRPSFGVEIEFLMPLWPGKEFADDIPGVAPMTNYTSGQEAVIALLRDRGICAEEPGDNSKSTGRQPWIVHSDITVNEDGGRVEDPMFIWQSVEIASPPMYACDEANELVSAIIRLITTKLRARVNTSCGLHVHVGNGPHPLDLRALRNYSALLWASEPVLSTLQCPTRSFTHWARSIRRCDGVALTAGVTADMARGAVQPESGFVARYLSRARYLGQRPVAPRAPLRRHIRQIEAEEHGGHGNLDPECESDDSDFEAKGSKPFKRPRKPKGIRRDLSIIPPVEADMGQEACDELLDSESIRRELPPQIVFPALDLTRFRTSSDTAPLLDKNRTKRKGASYEEVKDMQLDRYCIAELEGHQGGNSHTKLTWNGVAELMACDYGAHQVAYLMTDCVGFKGYSSNWAGQLGRHLLRNPQKTGSYKPTVESRLGGGSLDAEWIVIWIKIQCRMLEWARDAEPARFMATIGKLSRNDHSKECTYDVLDLLRDLGMYTEIRYCRERLTRCEEAWFECMMMEQGTSEDSGSYDDGYALVSSLDTSNDEDSLSQQEETAEEWKAPGGTDPADW